MIFKNATDYGTAPEISVGEVASVERISPGQVRVSYASTFRGPDGKPENRIAVHLVWDLELWLRMDERFTAARRDMAVSEPLSGAAPDPH